MTRTHISGIWVLGHHREGKEGIEEDGSGAAKVLTDTISGLWVNSSTPEAFLYVENSFAPKDFSSSHLWANSSTPKAFHKSSRLATLCPPG